eukprot:TRINITY_DN11044_c0_g2_i1.p1 TRINITY_DN11044_c0_g2~~TRINITY_DN11044_c0_g2_i1.p1  ORF type:complete len:152 (+),score=10.13 TRINITY_DN11044_c0_g2_i1:219-674(+)
MRLISKMLARSNIYHVLDVSKQTLLKEARLDLIYKHPRSSIYTVNDIKPRNRKSSSILANIIRRRMKLNRFKSASYMRCNANSSVNFGSIASIKKLTRNNLLSSATSLSIESKVLNKRLIPLSSPEFQKLINNCRRNKIYNPNILSSSSNT